MLLKENIDNLKAAIRAMMGLVADPEYADCRDYVKWALVDLKRMLVDQTAFEKAMAEALGTLIDKSTTLSPSTKESLSSIKTTLSSDLSETDTTALKSMITDVLTEAEASEAADKDKQAQADRSKRYNIRIHGSTHITKPSEWSTLSDSEFADPVNYKYPIHDKAHADNAAARLAQNEGDYNSAELAFIKGRIEAAQKMKESIPVLSASVTSIPVGYSVISEQVQILAESPGSESGTAFDMVVIVEGMNKAKKVKYPWDKLQESKPKLDGKSFYVDHPSQNGSGIAERSLGTKAGWWSNVREGQVRDGGILKNAIIAQANIFKNSGVPWIGPMIKEAIDRGNPTSVGISILAIGKTKVVKENTDVYLEVTELLDYASADAVGEAGAGGRPINIIESFSGGLSEMEIKEVLASLTLEQISEMRPDLVEEWKKVHGATSTAVLDPPQSDALASIMKESQAQLDTLRRTNTQTDLNSVLSESGLAPSVQSLIRTEVGDQILTHEQLAAMVTRYKTILSASITPDNFAQFGFLGYHIPTGDVEVGLDVRERVQLAADHFFGVPVPDDKIGKFEKIRSFREFYIAVTGDTEFNGYYNPSRSILREALPGASHVVGGGTITMSGLLGVSMNRAVVKAYQDQPRWWEPIVTKTELTNMKQQTRLLLHNFGSLTERTVDGAEYVELDWGETSETYSPTEYGNVVTVGRRAIINDDLRKIQSIPQLLASSAGLTLNEFVSTLFTQNSGNGPTLTDGVQVFNAASHQGNRVTTALNRANLIALRRVIMKMQNAASKRIGLVPRHLLVPIDLEDVAWGLVFSNLVPDSANNEQNLLANAQAGLRPPIVVPNFTDTNNWYLMADPAQITSLELGFLFGREVPDLLAQENPATGMVFTNDVIAYKVRWDFGGDWVDFRGAAAAIVA